MTENFVPPIVPDPVGADDHPPASPVIPTAPVLSNVEGVEGSHNKKSPVLLFIALVLLSIVSVLAIYLFLQVRTLTLEKTAPSPTPSPIVSSDPTVDWQAYTNQKLGFSFKYPSVYKMEEKGNKDYINIITNKNEPQKDQIGIDAQSITNNITYEKILSTEKAKLTDTQEIIVDKWLKILGDGTGYSEGEKFSIAIIKYRDNAIKISTISQDSSVLNNFDRILSTFKFTN